MWALDESQWAAITPERDRWVFAGNPDYLTLSLDLPKPPDPPPGIYQAKVIPAAGLNVRDAAGGNKVGALPGGRVVQVYEEKEGFARVNPEKSEWVAARYLNRMR